MRRHNRSSAGMTLIMLIILTAILALLAVLLFPAIARQQSAAAPVPLAAYGAAV